MVRTAVLAGLLLTPALGAAGEPPRSTPLSQLDTAVPRWIDAVLRQLPWAKATGEGSTDAAVPEASSEGSQDAEGGPGWNPDGLMAGTDDDADPGDR